jgi:hypothetical protein
MAQALQETLPQTVQDRQQLGFFDTPAGRTARRLRRDVAPVEPPLCAGCRAKEARYGFRRREDDPSLERPRTLCFECFRVELAHRETVAARLARGWNASQVPLPLEDTLNELSRRRRRAQIAARHALGLS